MKVTERRTGVNVDISFNRTNGVAAVRAVKAFSRKFPDLKYLLLVIKCYLRGRGLNETFSGGLGSYLLTLMVVAFLQCAFKTRTRTLLLSELLINFFEFYGHKLNY